MPFVSRLAIAIAALFLVSPSARHPPVQSCTGCTGIGSAASASGGNCDGLVTVTVTVGDGHCKVLNGEEPGDIHCKPNRNCVPTISRTWTGLDPGSVVDFCVVLNGERLCAFPKPTSGNGAGSDNRPSASMECTDDPALVRWYSVESPSCGLFATAQGKCSACNDYY